MTAPLYVVVLPVSITLCIIADRTPGLRPVYLFAVLGIGGIFSALIAGILNYTARYVFLCFVNIAMWSANPLALSYASTTFGPKEVRVIFLSFCTLRDSMLITSLNSPKSAQLCSQ